MSKLPHSRFKSSSNQNKIERKFYKVWAEMVRRCKSETSKKNTKSYINKNIEVCERWNNFDYFFIDMWDNYIIHRNMYNGDTEIDRINNDKGYSPSNCRWVTRKENMNNTGNVRIINGKTLSEWSIETGIKVETLKRRIDFYKWPLDKVFTEQTGTWRNRK